MYPLGAETQEECATACLREPECNFWTHNPNVGRCWLKKSDLGRSPSSKGSNSGQKSCGVTGGRYFKDNAFMGFLFQKTTSSLAVLLKMAVTAPQRQPKVIELLHVHEFIAIVEVNEQYYTQPAQSRRTRSTPGTTCTRGRASRLETGLGVLPSALRTASASSGPTTRGIIRVFHFLPFASNPECPSAG